MAPRWNEPSRLLLALFAVAIPAAAEVSAPADRASAFSSALVAEINAGREQLDLAPVATDNALAEVAQRRADAMADEGWFGLVSPAGRNIEAELDDAGYRYLLVTEKLMRSPLSPGEIGGEWRLKPDASRQSLFHVDVRRVGIGVRDFDDTKLIEIVLAAPPEDEPATAFASGRFDVEHAIRELVAAIADKRRAAARSPLRTDSDLAEAAQQHAEALLRAFARGDGAGTVEPFGDRLSDLERSRGRAGVATGGSKIWQRDTGSMSRSSRYSAGAITLGIVVDARSVSEALATITDSPAGPDLLDPGLRRLGVGVARSTDDGNRLVWVVAATKR